MRPPEPLVTDVHWELINQCCNKVPHARPPAQEVQHRLIVLHRESADITLIVQHAPVAHKSRTTYIVKDVLTPNSYPHPSPILKLASYPSTSLTFDQTSLQQSTLKMQTRPMLVHDCPANTASPNYHIESSRGLRLADDKHVQQFLRTQPSQEDNISRRASSLPLHLANPPADGYETDSENSRVPLPKKLPPHTTSKHLSISSRCRERSHASRPM